jgi:predicted negative regulator of RcsB-dependent stress response
MAKHHKMTRRELRHDEVKDFNDHLQEWFRKYSKSLGTVLTVCIVVFAAYVVYGRYAERKIATASREYYELVTSYLEALNASDDTIKEKYNTAVLAADNIIELGGNSAVARNARLIKGNLRYYEALALDPARINNETSASEFMKRREDAFKGAREAFDEALQSAVSSTEKAEARLALAQTHESMAFLSSADDAKQLVKDAIDNYRIIIELVPGSWLSAEAVLGFGRCTQAQTGKEQEAAALYASVAKDRALASLAEDKSIKVPLTAQEKKMTKEQVDELRQRSKLSYEAVAKKLASSLASETVEPQ